MGAMGPLMGIVMQKAGAADGKIVSSLLKSNSTSDTMNNYAKALVLSLFLVSLLP